MKESAMVVTKKSLSRRTVLRGIGATLALPLLDSMLPAFTPVAKSAARPVHRLGVVYPPNGMIMQNWLPKDAGPLGELTPTLAPLTPFRDQLLVLSGLDCKPGPGRPGGAHAKASTRFLTDVSPPQSETLLDAGISMDQIAAKELGKHTQLSSLEIGIEGGDMAGACDNGFACAYNNTISWSNASTPLPMQNDPRTVFERLFGDSGSTDPKIRLARLRRDSSLLDSLTEEVGDLQGSLGPSDRLKLTEYLESIRDVERRIQNAEEQSGRELPVMEHPVGVPAAYEEHAKLMFDLEVLAYQADLTRIVTFMYGREQSGMTYPQIGVADAHHPISHHLSEPEKLVKVSKINRYHVTLFAYLLDRLRSTPDGDGTLLDHMTMIYGCGIADSNSHAPFNIPVALVGGGAGRLKGGRHISYPGGTPLANLHLTLLDQLGVRWDQIGDSTGRLDDRQLSGI
jgi:hypothetical protein